MTAIFVANSRRPFFSLPNFYKLYVKIQGNMQKRIVIYVFIMFKLSNRQNSTENMKIIDKKYKFLP